MVLNSTEMKRFPMYKIRYNLIQYLQVLRCHVQLVTALGMPLLFSLQNVPFIDHSTAQFTTWLCLIDWVSFYNFRLPLFLFISYKCWGNFTLYEINNLTRNAIFADIPSPWRGGIIRRMKKKVNDVEPTELLEAYQMVEVYIFSQRVVTKLDTPKSDYRD